MVHIRLKPYLDNFEHYFPSVWDECNCVVVWALFGIAFLSDWNENWLFQSCGHCWIFQICWHTECSTFTASAFKIWKISTRILSPPPALFIVMLCKAYLNLLSRKFGLGIENEAGQRLIAFCQENTLVRANTLFQKHKRLYTRMSPDGQHRNQIDFILCSQRWRNSIKSGKIRPIADFGSDSELFRSWEPYTFRLKLKKVEKTTRPFRNDLNEILNDYTVGVRNRFKGLDLIDRVPDELWTEVLDIVQDTGIKTISKKEMQISKMAAWGGFIDSYDKKGNKN